MADQNHGAVDRTAGIIKKQFPNKSHREVRKLAAKAVRKAEQKKG